MLRNFTAALLATALVAGPAFAAQPLNGSGTSAPAAAAAPAAPASTKGQITTKQTEVRKPAKSVKHARSHVRHRAVHVSKHLAKHVTKPGKATKSMKSSA
jgi:hypothetical protein